jgi:hypothetical protein
MLGHKLIAIFNRKRFKKVYVVFFSSVFGHQNPGSGLDPYPGSREMLDPDPQL